MQWKDDRELFRLVKKELFTALVGDILDTKNNIISFCVRK